MSVIKSNALQIGQSVTATNNFTWYQPASPDGTVRLGNGNSGSVTDLVTLTSAGNLGIGTSSPAQVLDVQKAQAWVTATSTTGTNSSVFKTANTGGSSYFGRESSAGTVFGGGAYATVVYGSGAYPMSFFTNDTKQMTLDSSGNLGLGVTPSGWGNGYKAFELGYTSIFVGSSTDTTLRLAGNAYFNGTNWIYKSTDQAARYSVNGYGHIWYTAPSGTAGNAISFTQAMTLDASGRLFVGTSSNVSGNATLTLKGATSQSSLVLGNSAGSRQADFNENGNLYLDIVKNNTTASAANVYIDPTFAVMYRSTSARKYKQDIRDLESIDINKFRPVRYKSKCENDDQSADHLGLIADEVLEAGFPELVILGAENQPEGFQYERLTVVLLKAIQELSAELNELKQKVNA